MGFFPDDQYKSPRGAAKLISSKNNEVSAKTGEVHIDLLTNDEQLPPLPVTTIENRGLKTPPLHT